MYPIKDKQSMAHIPFVLLDDCQANAADPRSRLYTACVDVLVCNDVDLFPAMLVDMQKALAKGLYAVTVFSYELGAQLIGTALRVSQDPLAQILIFKRCEYLSNEEVSEWLTTQTKDDCAGVANIRATINEDQFIQACDKIRAYIQAGDVYQVNYTYRLHFDVFGDALSLYQRLRQRQPVPYGALIQLPDGAAVLSFSPELFIEHHQGNLIARPMKGTATADQNAEKNKDNMWQLKNDFKNQAENVMIVDLLRNDLGRIAQLGSVDVPTLFQVAQHGGVLQMTSDVHAKIRSDVTLFELIRAVYPCGSITGAPKRRAMEIICEQEPDARGIYTGAIGWFDSTVGLPSSALGDFCLSVPIRTLVLDALSDNVVRRGVMGIGAGIVYDSDPREEYKECALKAQFLTGLQYSFNLFETMYVTHEGGYRYLDRHLARLRSSAQYFGFIYDDVHIEKQLIEALHQQVHAGEYRAKLILAASGECQIEITKLLPITLPVKLLIAKQSTNTTDIFLRHKTTMRACYDQAWRSAEVQGAFDAIFFNERGELTEGGRSNIFVQINGQWYTPPISAGLLPGVMRSVVLADKTWNVIERNLTIDDVRGAQKIVLCNALRGVMSAVISQDDKEF